MSLQDDIYDVESALKGTPEAESYKKIMHIFIENENELVKLREEAKIINNFMYLLKEKFNES